MGATNTRITLAPATLSSLAALARCLTWFRDLPVGGDIRVFVQHSWMAARSAQHDSKTLRVPSRLFMPS